MTSTKREPDRERRDRKSSKAVASKAPLAFMAPSRECSITAIPLTTGHFLDAYSKGKWNLSKVPCPPCYHATGYLEASECYNEVSRCKMVEKYAQLPHWSDRALFKKLIGRARKTFGVSGVSVSLVDRTKTVIQFETLLEVTEMPRGVSLDGHTILSQGYFFLADASKDWRTSRNPFVTAAPHIRFYCGVPLLAAKNEPVGVLAVFDSFAANDFSEESCKRLQGFAKEVMVLLDTPYHEIRRSSAPADGPVDSIASELCELKLKLGRATSTKSVLKSVFERDGSGSPYSQNHNFRFKGLQVTPQIPALHGIDNKVLWDKLFRIGSMKSSAAALTKMVAMAYQLDFVYILEIRIAEPYQIPSECFPSKDTKIEAENFRFADRMVKQTAKETEFMTRVIGSYGCSHSSLSFENAVHYKAFTSEFGVVYKNSKQNCLYNKGIIMPIYRHNSKLVRASKEREKGKSLNIHLRSGGFLIALLSESLNADMGSEMISSIFTNTSVFRKLYITA